MDYFTNDKRRNKRTFIALFALIATCLLTIMVGCNKQPNNESNANVEEIAKPMTDTLKSSQSETNETVLIKPENTNSQTQKAASANQTVQPITPKQTTGNKAEIVDNVAKLIIGTYTGRQPSYNLKNKSGDDIVFNGSPMKIPAVDYTIVLRERNKIEITQESTDGDTYNYKGSYSILNKTDNEIKIKVNCATYGSDADGKLTFTMLIDKGDYSANVYETNKQKDPTFPRFNVQKNEGPTSSSE